MVAKTTRAAVVIASAGRPALLADVVGGLKAQSAVAFQGVVSVPDEASLPEDRSVLDGWQVLVGVRGSAAQRNVGLDVLGDEIDVVFFFDDDAVIRSDYIATAMAFFKANPEVVGLTGRVLLDGKLTGEITPEASAAVLKRSLEQAPSGRWTPTRELYGANFAARRTAAPDLRFDGRLPLYSWLEDHDFARRLMAFGKLAKVEDCVIVHRAAGSGGRTRHVRLGYSQVMNAAYLVRKGSFPVWLGAQQIGRPLAKNVVLSLGGPSKNWRRQRLRGNALAVADVLRGRITPERIVDLDATAGLRS